MINEPVNQRRRPFGPKFVLHGLDRLEGVQHIQFVAKKGVLQPAKPLQGLWSQTLAGDDLPAEPAGGDFGAGEELGHSLGRENPDELLLDCEPIGYTVAVKQSAWKILLTSCEMRSSILEHYSARGSREILIAALAALLSGYLVQPEFIPPKYP